MITGSAVEPSDELTGRGEHDRVEPRRSVGNPSVECILGCGGEIADMDTAVIVLRFANGALCSIDNSRRAVYGYDQRLEVFGATGCLSVPNRTPRQIERWDAFGQHRARPLDFFL